MKHVRTCMYCATNFNLLPGVLLTPLHGTRHQPLPELMARLPWHYQTIPVTGFRLALKLWRWHLGWEFHFGGEEVFDERTDCV